MDLTELVTKYGILKAKIKERESVIKEMKVVEEKMAGMILNHLNASSMTTVNFTGVGRVEKSTRDHVEIRDREKMANFVIMQAIRAKKNGTPLSDALSVLQQRAALGNIQDLIEQGFSASDMGVEVVQKSSIKFTKA